jgi:hypothetical protein
MGIRLLRWWRAALARTPPIKVDLSESRSVHRCGFFRGRFAEVAEPRIFPGAFDSPAFPTGCPPGAVLRFPEVASDTENVKIVVGMQHPLTTFFWNDQNA